MRRRDKMSSNILAVLNQLASFKQLDKEMLTEIIKESLYSTISKKLLPENELKIHLDFTTNDIYATFKKKVVLFDSELGEISLNEAKKQYGKGIEIDDTVDVKMHFHEFGPKIIKNAKKAIQERIKSEDANKTSLHFENQKNTIVTGKVKAEGFGGIRVDIGYTTALLPPEEQIEEEYYKQGDIIKAYVTNIRRKESGVTIILSRTNPEFVKKLFENEIPEIFNGDIIIKKIVREPGIRTKVEVYTEKDHIDAAGSCLGTKGLRIDSIRKELHGEQIDIVVSNPNSDEYVANAIGKDLVERVIISERGKFARVIVKEKNKNLAIGKKGKNVRLAAKLTNYNIDIFTKEEFNSKLAEERRITNHVSELDGVTPNTAQILKSHGYTSVQDIYLATVDELCNLGNIGAKTAEKLKESAEAF